MNKAELITTEQTDAERAFDFVERNRALFETYVKGKIKFKPAPEGLNTFAFSLVDHIIYISDRFMKDRGLTFADPATIFAVFHECERFLEKIALLNEERGETFFPIYLSKIRDGAYGLMDNLIAGMRENTAVVYKYDHFAGLVPRIYKENLWVGTDFRDEPLHIQFIFALSREFQVKDEICQVADEVREEINRVRAIASPAGISLIDIMANPELPMIDRVSLQDQYIWPVVDKLRKKDIENKNNEDDTESGESEEDDLDNESSDGGEDQEGQSGDEENKAKDGSDDKKTKKKPKTKKPGEPAEPAEPKETDPNKIFKDDYNKAKENGMPTVSVDDLDKAFKDWVKVNGVQAKKDRAFEERAKGLGVKKEDLKTYEKIREDLAKAVNKETGENLKDELISLISRIISKRIKQKPKPRYPLEEGPYLVDPVEAVVQVRAGNFRPAVWGDVERRESKGDLFGEVEVTLVCDRSDSMNRPSAKLLEQRKALVFLCEAIKTLNIMLTDEESNLIKELLMRLEVYSFQQTDDDTKPIKELDYEITDKECIDAMVKVSTAPGDGTTDFITLKAIRDKLSPETLQKIKEGELKKIVIVFTDGESNDRGKVQEEIKALTDCRCLIYIA